MDRNLTKIDQLDFSICKEISEDCRKSYRQIGEKLNKSPGTIKKRIEKLESLGVIKKWGAQLDYQKLGYDFTAIIELDTMRSKTQEILKNISKSPNVFGIYDVTGDYEAIIMVRTKTRSEFRALSEKLFDSHHIKKVTTHVVLKSIKDDSNLYQYLI
ncbi:MAG: Lrp/AsnC family transcriptional regulator [Promethearchaeota archaeon]